MLSFDEFRSQALAFPEVTEQPHFDKNSFRVKKRIFATLDAVRKVGCLKLSAVDQSVFMIGNEGAVYPAKGAWGKQGWTLFELDRVHHDLLGDALRTAYLQVAPRNGLSGREERRIGS